MAVMETKIIQVNNDPQVINEANTFHGSFGWIVQNVQITHSKNSAVTHEQFGDVIFENKETETINYATITYQRNRGMTHYDEIVGFEQEYQNLTKEINGYRTKMQEYSDKPFWLWLFFLWPFGVYRIIKNMTTAKERAEKQAQLWGQIDELKTKQSQILKTASSLVD